MINAYTKFFKNYVNFSGKTSRKDYWLAYLMNVIISIVLVTAMVIMAIIAGITGINSFGAVSLTFILLFSFLLFTFFVYAFAILIPGISITIRRLRDGGYHWAFYFISFIPWIGSVVLIILLCMPTSINGKNIFDHHEESNATNLEKWYNLKESGVITAEEYEAKKKEFL